jgi:hypothetical protein
MGAGKDTKFTVQNKSKKSLTIQNKNVCIIIVEFLN